MKRGQSTCNFCAIDCNLDFCVEDGRIVRTIPTKGYPVNDGFSCIKGLSLSKQQTTVKPDALPKIRQADGTMKEVSRSCRPNTGLRASPASAQGS